RRDYLRLHANNKTYDFHYFWLRHNCNAVPQSRHPLTNERIVDCAHISLDLPPTSVKLIEENSKVEVQWPPNYITIAPICKNSSSSLVDSHTSTYSIDWLISNAYAVDRIDNVQPDYGDIRKVEIDYKNYINNNNLNDYFRDCYQRLKQYGLVVVRNRGLDTETVIRDFLPDNCHVFESHFGVIEDLRTDNKTNKNTDQLGYTNSAVDLHTDQPFIDNPPGMQMLQCIQKADIGGDNHLVNSHKAALYLREINPEAFYLLSTVAVKFHRKQKQFESLHVGPIIELEENGNDIKKVRHSYFTFATFQYPFWLMNSFYKAYQAYSTILKDEKYTFNVLLESGDFLLYDNYRMLHARKEFQGERFMRGIYFNHEQVWTKLEFEMNKK
ncbi:unnamed protein product, partial [Didymodactylos carnosus]